MRSISEIFEGLKRRVIGGGWERLKAEVGEVNVATISLLYL